MRTVISFISHCHGMSLKHREDQRVSLTSKRGCKLSYRIKVVWTIVLRRMQPKRDSTTDTDIGGHLCPRRNCGLKSQWIQWMDRERGWLKREDFCQTIERPLLEPYKKLYNNCCNCNPPIRELTKGVHLFTAAVNVVIWGRRTILSAPKCAFSLSAVFLSIFWCLGPLSYCLRAHITKNMNMDNWTWTLTD